MQEPDDVDGPRLPCPPWCETDHARGEAGPRVHRGPLRSTPARARRRRAGEVAAALPGEEESFAAQLVRYDGDASVWISIQTRTSDPIEVALTDANRWIMLLGQVMVDASVPER